MGSQGGLHTFIKNPCFHTFRINVSFPSLTIVGSHRGHFVFSFDLINGILNGIFLVVS